MQNPTGTEPTTPTAKTTTRRRRQPGTWGTVRPLASGKLQASYTVDGRRYNGPLTFTRRTAARAWLNRTRVSIEDGTWVSPAVAAEAAAREEAERRRRSISLGDYADRWIDTHRTPKGDALRPNTIDQYRRMMKGPLARLAETPIGDITRGAIAEWADAELAAGRGKTSVGLAYTLLRTMLAGAVERGLLIENPATLPKIGRLKTGRKVEPPARAELAIMADTIAPRYRAMLLICAWCGLRFGEVTALQRADIDILRDPTGAITGMMIHVTRAVTHTSAGTQVGAPKSARGVRDVWVPALIWDDVVHHLDIYTAPFGRSLIFTAEAHPGQFVLRGSIAHSWDAARLAAGRPDCPWHSLRHFAATRHAEAGASVMDTMLFLGHASIQTSMGYQHSTGREAALAAAMK